MVAVVLVVVAGLVVVVLVVVVLVVVLLVVEVAPGEEHEKLDAWISSFGSLPVTSEVLRKPSDVALWPLNCTNTSSLAGKHRVKSDSILTLSCRLTKAAVSDCTRDAFQAASTAPFCLVAPQEGKKQSEEDERRGVRWSCLGTLLSIKLTGSRRRCCSRRQTQ